MNYITEIFERTNLQHIREFLLHGVACMSLDEGTYKDRLDEADDTMVRFLRQKFNDSTEFEMVLGEIYRYVDACQNVHAEIGLQCGAIIAARLLQTWAE